VVVGEGRHLGQVGDDQDLAARSLPGSSGQGGQGPPHGQGGLTADSGVDLVEHHGGGDVGDADPCGPSTAAQSRGPGQGVEDQADGEHGPGQLASRRRLGQWQDGLAGVGTEEEGDHVARVLLVDLDPEAGRRHG
jgi:hypothetical protein